MVLSKEPSCLSQVTQGYSYRLGRMMSQEGWSIGIDREGRHQGGQSFCLLNLCCILPSLLDPGRLQLPSHGPLLDPLSIEPRFSPKEDRDPRSSPEKARIMSASPRTSGLSLEQGNLQGSLGQMREHSGTRSGASS